MKTLVVGIANQQTDVPVDGFPIEYNPARYLRGQIRTSVGGVGFNVARTLANLGGTVALAAPLGVDPPADAVLAEAIRLGVDTRLCTRDLVSTPRSVILYAPDGRRLINTDLGDATTASFDPDLLASYARRADAVVLGNLDLSRPLLPAIRAAGTPVVVDLQDVQGLDNPYDQDFLEADVLVMSHERVTTTYELLLQGMLAQSRAALVVLTRGAGGALALTRDDAQPWVVPAFDAGHVLSTTGAGDTFTAALTHFLYVLRWSVRRAVAAACASAAIGLSGQELSELAVIGMLRSGHGQT